MLFLIQASNTPRIVNDREEIIHIKGISIKGADKAEFISGGVLTPNILQAFIECLKSDEEKSTKLRIFFSLQDYVKLLCLFCTLNIIKFIMISTTK